MLESHAYIKYYQPYCGTVYQKFRAGEKKKKRKEKKSIESTRSVTVTGKSNRGRAVKAGAVKRTRARALSYLE